MKKTIARPEQSPDPSTGNVVIRLPALRFGDCPGCRTDARRVPSAHVRRWPGVYRCVVSNHQVAAIAVEDRTVDRIEVQRVEAEVHGAILASAGPAVVTLLLLRDLALANSTPDAALLSAVDELVRVEIEEEG